MFVYDLSSKVGWINKHYVSNGSLSKAVRYLEHRFPYHGEDLLVNFCLKYYPRPLNYKVYYNATKHFEKGTYIPFSKLSIEVINKGVLGDS